MGPTIIRGKRIITRVGLGSIGPQLAGSKRIGIGKCKRLLFKSVCTFFVCVSRGWGKWRIWSTLDEDQEVGLTLSRLVESWSPTTIANLAVYNFPPTSLAHHFRGPFFLASAVDPTYDCENYAKINKQSTFSTF